MACQIHDFTNRLVRGMPLIPPKKRTNSRRKNYSKKDKTVRVYLSGERTREKFNRRKNSKKRAYDAGIYFTLYHEQTDNRNRAHRRDTRGIEAAWKQSESGCEEQLLRVKYRARNKKLYRLPEGIIP